MKYVLTLLLMAALVSGCSLFSARTMPHYQENISSVLLTEDEKSIVVIGEQYHYIFSAPKRFVTLLNTPSQSALHAYFTGFYIRNSGVATGNLNLRIKPDAPATVKESVLESGFKANADGSLHTEIPLFGMRYRANGIQATVAEQRLAQLYSLQIVEAKPKNQDLFTAEMTPLKTNTENGLLTFYSTALTAIATGEILTGAGGERNTASPAHAAP